MVSKQVKKVNKAKEDKCYGHLDSNIFIRYSRACANCPLKLYADYKDTIKYGIGNIYSDIVLLINYYDLRKSKEWLVKLNKIWIDITDMPLLEDVYIARVIKCYNKAIADCANSAFEQCKLNALHEIIKIQPRKIITFGNVSDDFKQMVDSFRPVKWFETYNIGVLYYDNEITIKKLEEDLYKFVHDD